MDTADLPVVPAPWRAEPGTGAYALEGLSITAPPGLEQVAAVFVADVAADCGRVVGAGSGIRVELSDEGLDDVPRARGVRADGADGTDERYGLVVASDGVRVWSPTPEGVHRGLTTLRQLVSGAGETIPAVTVLDGPRFAWRGLSLDVVRAFHGPQTVRRVIDMLDLGKLNVLHLHLTDDQGWRFEVPDWPLLTSVGARGAMGDRPGGWFTPDDVAGIVAYAAERFITVVPEVDLPGHCQAVFAAYPQFAPPADEKAARSAELGMPIGTLDPSHPEVPQLLADAFRAAADQFTTSAYLHIGGDEAFGMPADQHARFVELAADSVRRTGRKVVGWQEVSRGQVGGDVVAQHWLDPAETAAMLEAGTMVGSMPADVAAVLVETFEDSLRDLSRTLDQGSRVLVSLSPRLYLDRPHGDEALDPAQRERRGRVGLPVYPPTTLRYGLEWDPATAIGVPAEELAGVEAAVWCETVTDRDDLELLLVPRLYGAAERAWTEAPTVWESYAARLGRQSPSWDRRGWAWFRAAGVDWA